MTVGVVTKSLHEAAREEREAFDRLGATTKPLRVHILEEGASLTNGARDASYGPPVVNLSCAGELKAVFRKHMRRDLSHGELEAIDMVLTKLGRVATGPKPVRDTYVDGATYFAIAGEIALEQKPVDMP